MDFLATGDPSYFNRYAYTANNPVNAIDPDGRETSHAVRFEQRAQAVFAGEMTQQEFMDAQYAEGAGVLAAASLLLPGPEDLVIAGAAAKFGTKTVNTAVKKGASGGARAGKDFTPAGKKQIDQNNVDRHGKPTCENCKTEVTPAQKSKKGISPPGNERQRDHIRPKSKGGDGTPENGQILCRSCNRQKSDREDQ